MAIVIDPE
jgi:hypothetical protein